MQSSRHDANLASLHASSLPGYVLDVVVLTADGGLLGTLRDASSAEHAIWHAPSADAAVDLLVGGRCGILIADLGTLRSDAAALLGRLHNQFPELVLMATGRRQEESGVAALVADGRIYRFLHKPVSPARASLFIGAATRRYFELRNTQPVALTTVKTIASRPHAGKIAAAAVGVLALAIGAAWFVMQDDSRATLHAPLGTEPSVEQEAADYLARAQIAYASGRFNEPRGDNALEYYRRTLTLAPNHPEALAGIERVAVRLEARVVKALEAGDPAAGATELASLRRAHPGYTRIPELQNRLIALSRSIRPVPAQRPPQAAVAPAEASAVTDAEFPSETLLPDGESALSETFPHGNDTDETEASTAELPDVGVDPAVDPEIDDALEQLAIAIGLRERGSLIGPGDNNAFQYMRSLIAQHPNLEGVRTEQQRLVFTLLEHTRTALAADDIDGAAAHLDRAEQLMPGMTAAQSLREEVTIRRQRASFATNIVQAATIKRTHEVPADYPRDARRNSIEGWVDIEFTIAADGTTQDFVIQDASPAGVFDRASIDALRRWRFEPVMGGDGPIAQRAILRMKFELR